MSALLEAILGLPLGLVLVLVFALPPLEASVFVGIVVPGEIGVILGGVLANRHALSLPLVLVAAVAGDSAGYMIGVRYGARLLTALPHGLVKPQHVQHAADAISRLGGRAIFAGRFTAALRALVPGIAGMARLPYRNFLVWNVLGGAPWAAAFVALGYLAGDQYQGIERYVNCLGLGLLAAVPTLLVVGHRRSTGTKAH